MSSLGFNNFIQDTTVNTIDGLDAKNFDRWANTVTKRIKGDNATKAAVEKYISMIPEAEAGKWNMFRTIYSVENSTQAYYVCIMTFRNLENKYKIYNIQMSNSF